MMRKTAKTIVITLAAVLSLAAAQGHTAKAVEGCLVAVAEGSSRLQDVISYVEKNGKTVSGQKVLSYSDGSMGGSGGMSLGERLGFYYLDASQTARISIVFEKDLSFTGIKYSVKEESGFKDKAVLKEFDMAAYTNDTALDWSMPAGAPSQTAAEADALFKNAMSCWDRILTGKLGFGMKDIGFTSYTISQSLITDSGVMYRLKSNGELEVTGAADLESITVKAEITVNGTVRRVTSISEGAFRKHTALKTVIIDAAVTDIGKKAFRGCSGLEDITVNGASLRSVGKNAFKGISAKAVVNVRGGKFKKVSRLISKATNRSITFKKG